MSPSHGCFSALFDVYALALSALARWASVRLLSSRARRSLRARASSFFRFFSCAFCALVGGGATIVVFDLLLILLLLLLFANGQLMMPGLPELCVENDECDGDSGVDGSCGGDSDIAAVAAAAVGVGKSARDGDVVATAALSSTLVTVPVGECVSER